MADQSSKSWAESYINDGYLLVPDLVTPQECEEIKLEMLKIFRGDYECKAIPSMPENATETEILDRIMCVGEPHTFSPLVHRYVEHPKICAVLQEIVGAHIPFWDGGVKCMQSMMLGKVPGHTGNPWHQDEHPIPTRDRSLVGAWIALDDATIDNGCLWVLPNSHRSGVIYDRHPHNKRDEFDSCHEAMGFDDSDEIPIEMTAGSVLFFNGYLLHRSKKNRSDSYRRVLVSHYCSTASWLGWKGQRNYRGVIVVSGDDPYSDEGYVMPNAWARWE
ncbi:MAG: phytanoyl-CoA dioxygenase family protein [Candidatus Poribacteria bacterium]|nr:phytanoyl-CoA dioxygenase family protein [Candidatus Poribacteria bacterium]